MCSALATMLPSSCDIASYVMKLISFFFFLFFVFQIVRPLVLVLVKKGDVPALKEEDISFVTSLFNEGSSNLSQPPLDPVEGNASFVFIGVRQSGHSYTNWVKKARGTGKAELSVRRPFRRVQFAIDPSEEVIDSMLDLAEGSGPLAASMWQLLEANLLSLLSQFPRAHIDQVMHGSRGLSSKLFSMVLDTAEHAARLIVGLGEGEDKYAHRGFLLSTTVLQWAFREMDGEPVMQKLQKSLVTAAIEGDLKDWASKDGARYQLYRRVSKAASASQALVLSKKVERFISGSEDDKPSASSDLLAFYANIFGTLQKIMCFWKDYGGTSEVPFDPTSLTWRGAKASISILPLIWDHLTPTCMTAYLDLILPVLRDLQSIIRSLHHPQMDSWLDLELQMSRLYLRWRKVPVGEREESCAVFMPLLAPKEQRELETQRPTEGLGSLNQGKTLLVFLAKDLVNECEQCGVAWKLVEEMRKWYFPHRKLPFSVYQSQYALCAVLIYSQGLSEEVMLLLSKQKQQPSKDLLSLWKRGVDAMYSNYNSNRPPEVDGEQVV